MHTQNTSLLKLLFATFPPQTGDLVAMMQAYEMSLSGHDKRDVEAAVNRLVRGEVPEHNPSFAPSASLLGAVVRKCMNDRLDSERRARKPALPPPDVVRTPESRERVRRLAEEAIRKLGGTMRTEDAERDKRMADLTKRTQERFDPPQDDWAMR